MNGFWSVTLCAAIAIPALGAGAMLLIRDRAAKPVAIVAAAFDCSAPLRSCATEAALATP